MALRTVRRYVKDPVEIEDVAHDALVQAWRHRTQLRDPERWAEWLAQIARNQAHRVLGRNVPIPVEELVELGEPDSRLDAVVEGADLRVALGSLSDSDQKILSLRYGDDLTQTQVAEQLGIGESAAKVRLSRARRRLANHLEEADSTQEQRWRILGDLTNLQLSG